MQGGYDEIAVACRVRRETYPAVNLAWTDRRGKARCGELISQRVELPTLPKPSKRQSNLEAPNWRSG